MKRHHLVLAAVAFMIAVALIVAWPRPDLTIDVLDVGDGDSILLRSGWVEVLVDTGPDRSVMDGLGESQPLFDRRIEAVILTHPHADHVVGLVHVLRRYRVDRIYYTASGDTPEWQAAVAAAKTAGVPMERLVQGMTLRLPLVEMEALWSPSGFSSAHGDENDYSAVLRVHGRDGPSADLALLTGDATELVETELVRSGLLRQATLLKAAHHGSRFSTTAGFVAAVSPKWAAISTGTRFTNHPAWLVLERLRRDGIRIWRTDQDGHIRFVFSGQDASVVPSWLSVWPPLVP